jgi:hypothetical protein
MRIPVLDGWRILADYLRKTLLLAALREIAAYQSGAKSIENPD